MKDVEQMLFLEEGVYEKTTLNKIGSPDIELRNIEDEENKDCEGIQLFISHNKKLFRYLFNKYSNSGFSPKIISSFDTLKEKLDTISIAELIKMLKDHNVTLRMISHAEVATILRLINTKRVCRNDLSALPFEGFIEFFIQVGIFIFSKDPYCLSHLPSLLLAKKLLEHFLFAAKARGENTSLYENPNATVLGDQDLIVELSKYIEQNPYYPLPEGYKKVEEKNLTEDFSVKPTFVIPEAFKVSLEIIDEILSKNFDSHIIEPMTKHDIKARVVPTIGKIYPHDPRSKRFMLPLNKVPRKEVLEPVKHPTTLKQLNTELIKPKLSPAMKLTISRVPQAFRKLTQEVAEVVAEIVQAVEEGKDSIGHQMKWGPSFVANKITSNKIERIKAEEGSNEEKERQRKMRALMLKIVIEGMKKEKETRYQNDLVTKY